MFFKPYLYISFLVLFFCGCSSKTDLSINEKINSISLDKNVVIANTPLTVKSPISIGIGLGGYVSKHVGIHMGTSVRPDISNDKVLVLQKAININNISLSSIISNEFDRQMKNDSFYKKVYVPFGANYKIFLYVSKYYLDEDIFSSKAQIKIYINAKIYNKDNNIVYETTQESKVNSIYEANLILNSKDILLKALNDSIKNSVEKIISHMKKN